MQIRVELKNQHWTIGSCLDLCVENNFEIYKGRLVIGPMKNGWCVSEDSILGSFLLSLFYTIYIW